MSDGVAAHAAGMSERDWRANLAAEFHPIGGEEPAETLPAVGVAGALVFVYVRGGTLHVSVDLDEAGTFFPDPVPVAVRIQGKAVFEGR